MRQSHEICRVIQDMIASDRHRWFPQLTASETQIILLSIMRFFHQIFRWSSHNVLGIINNNIRLEKLTTTASGTAACSYCEFIDSIIFNIASTVITINTNSKRNTSFITRFLKRRLEVTHKWLLIYRWNFLFMRFKVCRYKDVKPNLCLCLKRASTWKLTYFMAAFLYSHSTFYNLIRRLQI